MAEIGEHNRRHWDSKASEYDTKPWQKRMIGEIQSQLVEHCGMFGISKESESKQSFRLLDYACGPGTVTRALAPYTSTTLGIDVSDGMVAEYNRRAKENGTSDRLKAVHGNLLDETPYVTDGMTGNKDHDFAQNDEFNNFDAAIIGLGFHHFSNHARALRTVSERVKKGGVVGIIDLLPSEDHWRNVTDEQRKMMHKSGFTEDGMKEYMKDARLTDFQWILLPELVTMVMKDAEVQRRIFFARGRKQ